MKRPKNYHNGTEFTNPKRIGNKPVAQKNIHFRPDKKTYDFLKTHQSLGINKSETIRKALKLLEQYRTDPDGLLIHLKNKYPERWKYVNRKKFM